MILVLRSVVVPAVCCLATILSGWKKIWSTFSGEGRVDIQTYNIYLDVILFSHSREITACLLLAWIQDHQRTTHRSQRSILTLNMPTTDHNLQRHVFVKSCREFLQKFLGVYEDLHNAFDSMHHATLCEPISF